MDRAYISTSAQEVSEASNAELSGQLALKLPFAIEPAQRTAGAGCAVAVCPFLYGFMEFLIPRMGRRADLIVLQDGIIFVVEYTPTLRKSGKTPCQRPLGRFCFTHDPPWIPGQRIATRPD